jgi:hypothetical protein
MMDSFLGLRLVGGVGQFIAAYSSWACPGVKTGVMVTVALAYEA